MLITGKIKRDKLFQELVEFLKDCHPIILEETVESTIGYVQTCHYDDIDDVFILEVYTQGE